MSGRPTDDRYDRALSSLAAFDVDRNAPQPAADHQRRATQQPGAAQPAQRGTAQHGAIRRIGPFAALLPHALLGAVALVLLHGSTTASHGIGGFAAALLGAPTLLAVGVPLRSGQGLYLLAAGTSAVLWLALGAFAAARATRSRNPSWGRFWAEYVWMVAAVWLGLGVAALAANLVLGQALL